jgi:hypothetical protein
MKKASRLSAIIAIASLALAAIVGAPAKAADVQLKQQQLDFFIVLTKLFRKQPSTISFLRS